MARKYLGWLATAGVCMALGGYYLAKSRDLKKEVSTLNYLKTYGTSEIGERFHEYKDATGEYPSPEMFKDILLDSGLIPEGHEKEADNFRFIPKYDTEGKVVGGKIYHTGLDGDDDNGEDKSLSKKLSEMDKRLITPLEVIFAPDGDLILFNDISDYETFYRNNPFKKLKKS